MTDVTGVVTAVQEVNRFDEAALRDWLASRLAGAERGVTVRQFEGGQSNPTYLIATPAGRWVLRKKPAGPLLASAHMVEREHRIMTALEGSGVPVPHLPLFCTDRSVIGTEFFVMDYVHGRILRDPSLPSMEPADRILLHRELVDTLAKIHDVDWSARGLSDFGKPVGFIARQIKRWSAQYRSAETRPIAAMDWLIDWLASHLPGESAATVVHGDYRLDNLIVHPTEPRVLAVLDWELSTLGDPLADLGYFCIPYHLRREERGLRGLLGHDLGALGIPSEEETIELYCARRKIAVPAKQTIDFYLAFGLFRLAAIVAGIDARLRQGNASASNASEVAAQAQTFAEVARAIAEGSE